jgi:hypothetical protein
MKAAMTGRIAARVMTAPHPIIASAALVDGICTLGLYSMPLVPGVVSGHSNQQRQCITFTTR